MPAVSVVLPARNAATTIARAVASILDQTFRDLELIVVDDGSTDDTAAIAERPGDPRLRVVRRPAAGVAATANHATQLATAPIIARMDADDFAHPTRIERQLAYLERRDLDVVGCRVRIVDASEAPVPSMQRYERWINRETLDSEAILALRFVELPIVNPTILARRRYFEFGFRNDDLPEDYDLLLRAAAAGLRFGKVDDELFDWIDHGDRLTRTDPRYSPEAFDRCRRRHLRDGPLRDVEAVDLWGLGRTGKAWLRWLQGEGVAVRRGYEVSEGRIGHRIHGVLAESPDAMPPADGTPLVIAVGAEHARDRIRPHLAARGHRPGRDAWFVA